ncbi:hypothetical protein FRC09_014820 [Ceratobasidium sp. 395]|nr:hypothetical protein FRC09_014820 [Ceratobasidium sp. 395]
MNLEHPSSNKSMDVHRSDVEMNRSAKSESDVNMKGSDDSSSKDGSELEGGLEKDGKELDGSDGGSDEESDELVEPAPSSSPPRKKLAHLSIKSETNLAREIAFLCSQYAKGQVRDIKPKPTRPSVKPSATKKRAV